MKRSAMITWDQLRVALVILVAVGIIVLAGFKLGEAANLFTRRYDLVVFLPAANGLRSGGSVTLAGQLVGTVKEIQFLPVDFDTTRNLRIVARIDRSLRDQIRRDSEARLRTMGLLGDKVLDISPGTPRFAVLEPGDTLRAVVSLDYDAVIERAAGAVDDMVVLTHDLRSITAGLTKGQGTMGQLLTNRAMYDELTGALTRANALFTSLQNPNGTFGKILSDPTLYARLSGTVSTLDSTLRLVQSGEGSMGRLLRDTTLYTNLVGIAGGADSLMKLMTSENGMVSRLMSDETLYDQLTKLTTDLGAVLADVRRDPKRYTRGMICVLNCK